MKKNILFPVILSCFFISVKAIEPVSIQNFGVKPGNNPSVNKMNLQKAIDWASEKGAALFVEPSDEPYAVDGGIILKKNVFEHCYGYPLSGEFIRMNYCYDVPGILHCHVNFDCVAVGIHKKGSNTKNRNWQIAQGSIIANCGEKVENVHPIKINFL